MEGEGSCYRSGHFNEGRMVMLQKWPGRMVVMEVASLMERAWSCYRSGHFNEGRMVLT